MNEEMRSDLFPDLCVDVCMDVCMDVCVDVCVDVCMDVSTFRSEINVSPISEALNDNCTYEEFLDYICKPHRHRIIIK